MTLFRRLFGVVCGTAGLIGLLLCIAGIIGCWLGHSEVARRVDRAFDRADASLVRASGNAEQVRKRLTETKTELRALQDREREGASQPPAEKGARRALSKKAITSLNPQLGEAHQALLTATEISVVANGLLDAVAELPLAERAHVDVDRLHEASEQLAALKERMGKLSTLMEKVSPESDAEIGNESNRAGEILERILLAVDEASNRIDSVREDVGAYHSSINLWLDRLAIAITVLLGWIGAGQFSLLIHGKKLTFGHKSPP
jgi:flagellin-like hook-associated protein FlgL